MKLSTVPDFDVLRAFNIQGEPVLIGGGRGLCYSISDTVFRPSEDSIESQWIAELAKRLPESSSYRIAQPRHVFGRPETFVYNGWTAFSLLAGQIQVKPDFKQILTVSQSFHDDIRVLKLDKPGFLAQRPNRWRNADLVTWNEKNLDTVENVNPELLAIFEPVLDRLRGIMRALPRMDNQIIHRDLTGNILFQDNGPPGIIDITT